MPLPRFYCPIPLQAGLTIALPEAIAHHAARVLRLRDGADIVLFNGTGGQFSARLVLAGSAASAELIAHEAREAELAGQLTLVQGLPSGDKMDWVVEKAVEVGVTRLLPVAAERSVLQLSGARLDKRLQHWRRIAQAASEQCGRNRLMPVEAPLPLAACLQQHARAGLIVFCDPDAPDSLSALLPWQGQHITILVGPEGGWSAQEQEQALACGAKAARFGARILRTETAGIALASAVAALQGWT
jgi:16S rRNA (uracil1498-N3)-methyltransferase